MKVTHIYQKGDKKVNEDGFVCNEAAHIYAAIDGATGLNGVPGHIASHTIMEVLRTGLAGDNLADLVKKGNQLVGKKSMDYFQTNIGSVHDYAEIDKTQRSTTGMAAIQLDLDGGLLHYVHAADCMLFLQYENRDIRSLTYDLVQYLDDLAIQKIVDLRKQDPNMPLKQARKIVDPILLENRSKLNTGNGYGAIDGSPAALNHLDSGHMTLKRVCKIVMISDGMLLPVENGVDDAWEQSAKLVFAHGLDGLLEKIEQRENNDPECRKYPRLKIRDDKTGILIEL